MAESIAQFRASDGYAFYVRTYKPDLPARARIVLLHGIRSHAGWYETSCRRLAELGFEVHALDRRGSGWNTAYRGDCPSFRRLLRDVTEYIMHLRHHRAFTPTILAGISWGGKLALALPAFRPGIVDGVALLCPGICPRIQPPISQRLRYAVASILRPTRTFPIPLNEPELFTAHAEWQSFIRENPHDLHDATARFYANSFRLDLYLRRNARRVKTPVLLMLAEHDRIVHNARTRAMLARLKNARSVGVIDYPGAHHTLEFEPAMHLWIHDFARWCDAL